MGWGSVDRSLSWHSSGIGSLAKLALFEQFHSCHLPKIGRGNRPRGDPLCFFDRDVCVCVCVSKRDEESKGHREGEEKDPDQFI